MCLFIFYECEKWERNHTNLTKLEANLHLAFKFQLLYALFEKDHKMQIFTEEFGEKIVESYLRLQMV